MNGRTYVLILFFWAVLTIVTPMLVRLSASAKPSINFNGMRYSFFHQDPSLRFFLLSHSHGMFLSFAGDKKERTKAVLRRLLPPRPLVATAPTQAPALPLAPAPAPAPSPHNGIVKRQVVTTFVQEQ